MSVYRCNVCQKQLSDDLGDGIAMTAAGFRGRGFFARVLVCLKCGNPIVGLLRKRKFVKTKRAK